ncbi:hypothetical protein [Halorubrum sp. CBA1125]|uniref:hypothetical protein n=1 Tax=Halorubrum sp. CBA1125 TaxID=2668072 RepID=UPI002AA29A81|nr:hypothetical protein [Halorubrum sp. CBA1125]
MTEVAETDDSEAREAASSDTADGDDEKWDELSESTDGDPTADGLSDAAKRVAERKTRRGRE